MRVLEKYFSKLKDGPRALKDDDRPIRKDRRGNRLLATSEDSQVWASSGSEDSAVSLARRARQQRNPPAAKALDFNAHPTSTDSRSTPGARGDSGASRAESDDETNVAFGPTTRRKWSEWVAKPKSPGGVCGPKTASRNTESESGGPRSKKQLPPSRRSSQASQGSQYSDGEQAGSGEAGGEESAPKRARNQTSRASNKRRANNLTARRKRKAARGGGGGRAKSTVSDTLDFFHQQTLNAATQQQYSSAEFNEKSMRVEPPPPTLSPNEVTTPAAASGSAGRLPLGSPKFSPGAPSEATSAALQKLLDSYKQQMLGFLRHMQSPDYREQLQRNIAAEKQRNQQLQARVLYLEKQIVSLQRESMAHLKSRLAELGISAGTPAEFLAKAKEIVMRHQELQQRASVLQDSVAHLELEKAKLVQLSSRHPIYEKSLGTNKGKNGTVDPLAWVNSLVTSELQSNNHRMSKLPVFDPVIPTPPSRQTDTHPDKPPPIDLIPGAPATHGSTPPRAASVGESPSKSAGAESPARGSLNTSRDSAGSTGSGRGRGGARKSPGRGGRARKESPAASSSTTSGGQETLNDRIKDIITTALLDGAGGGQNSENGKASPKRARANNKRKATAAGHQNNSKVPNTFTLPVKIGLDGLPMPGSTLPVSIPLMGMEGMQAMGMPGSEHMDNNLLRLLHQQREYGSMAVAAAVSSTAATTTSSSQRGSTVSNHSSGGGGGTAHHGSSGRLSPPPFATGVPSRRHLPESYSPISRPGSSSSTASAESVRALVHGGDRVLSPHITAATAQALKGHAAARSDSGSTRGTSQSPHRPAASGRQRTVASSPHTAPPHSRPGSVPAPGSSLHQNSSHDAGKLGFGPFGGALNSLGAMFLGGAYPAFNTAGNTAASREPYEKMLLAQSYPPHLIQAQLEAAAAMMYQQRNGLSKCDQAALESIGGNGRSRPRRPSASGSKAGASNHASNPGDLPMLGNGSKVNSSLGASVNGSGRPSAISNAESVAAEPPVLFDSYGFPRSTNNRNEKLFLKRAVPSDKDFLVSHRAATSEAMKESSAGSKQPWQAQLSSGFDALIGFASNELDRVRRKAAESGAVCDSWRGCLDPPPLTKQTTLGHNGPSSDGKVNHQYHNGPSLGSSSKQARGGSDKQDSHQTGRKGQDSAAPRPENNSSSTSKERSRSSSSESRSSRTRTDLSRSGHAESIRSHSRSRSRSRSPQQRTKEAEDLNYLKCFKKKFYGKAMSNANKSVQGDEPSKYVHGTFRPKGKDWKKNMPRHERSPDGKGDTRDSSQAATECSKDGGEGGVMNENSNSQRPPSRPQSSSSHQSNSAFHSTGLERASPSYRHPLHSPSPLGRPPSGTPVPHSTSPMSRSSGPPSRPGSDSRDHPFALHSPFSRLDGPPPSSRVVGHVPLLAGLPLMHNMHLAAHMNPLFSHPSHSAAAAAFGLGLLPPGLRPPLAGVEALRPATDGRGGGGSGGGGAGSGCNGSGESASQRHSFGGEPQIFNPLARHGFALS